jgi:hypothetical protein
MRTFRTLIAFVILCLAGTTAFASDADIIWAGGGWKVSANSNPCYTADSFISLGQIDSMNLFTEPMATLKDGDLGLDLGIGARLPLLNGRIVGGYNLFYDYTSAEGLMRLGTGFEVFHPLFSTHLNIYLPLSDERGGREALPGFDLTFGIPIPNASFITIWPGYYFYSGRDESDMKGLSLTAQINPIRPLFVSIGGRNDTLQSGRHSSEMFFKAEVRVPLNRLGKDLMAFNPGTYPISVNSRMDHKVMREEFITYENKDE